VGTGCLIMIVFTALIFVLPSLGFGACLGSLFAAAGLPVAWIGVRNAMRMMEVLRNGAHAKGTVVRVSDDTRSGHGARGARTIPTTTRYGRP
jgi:hypothetical protein